MPAESSMATYHAWGGTGFQHFTGGVVASPRAQLPPGAAWALHGGFGARHYLNTTNLREWPRSCCKEPSRVAVTTYCFTPHHVEYYWDRPARISDPVDCPASTVCSVSPSHAVEKHVRYSQRTGMSMVKHLISHMRRIFKLKPTYIFYGKLPSASFVFKSPAKKTLAASVLHIQITGKHEEFRDHEGYDDTRMYTFPLVIKTDLDAAVGLVDA